MKSLEEKLALVDEVFGLENIVSVGTEIEDIKKYYKINKPAYKVFHSKSDLVHMGISRDGKFKEEDLYEQPRFVEKYILDLGDLKSVKVLELAAGKGASSLYLARKYSEVGFYALDLPDGQFDVAKVKAKNIKNLKLVEGDYHDLGTFEDGEFNIVFIIEALCYSRKKDFVAREVYRVLKNDGVFILFDGYMAEKVEKFSEKDLKCCEIVSRGMAVERFDSYSKVKKDVESEGFITIYEEDVSEFIIPTLERLEGFASKFVFSEPKIGRLLVKFLPREFSYNAASAYLFPDLIKKGLAKYMISVFRK